jgi:hypothetical protein
MAIGHAARPFVVSETIIPATGQTATDRDGANAQAMLPDQNRIEA